MTTTMLDPRLALCDRRACLQITITQQRAAFKAMCGCLRCGDAEAREQLATFIHRNTLELDDLTDAITDRTP